MTIGRREIQAWRSARLAREISTQSRNRHQLPTIGRNQGLPV
jgi:hypothetical protein